MYDAIDFTIDFHFTSAKLKRMLPVQIKDWIYFLIFEKVINKVNSSEELENAKGKN